MPHPVSKIIVLAVALGVFISPGAAAAAVDQEQPNPTVEGINRQIANLDKQKQDVLAAPVDFCDPEAVKENTGQYTHLLFQQEELRRKLAKTPESVGQAVRKVVQDLTEDGDLVVFSDTVENYEAASRRGDHATMSDLRARMSRREQAQAANWEHRYFDAITLYTPLADQGDTDAQARLVGLYAMDYGPPLVTKGPPSHDDAMAFKYARMLAVTGNVFGQEQMAKAYACGLGTTKDPVRAYVWFNAAIGQSAVSLRTYYEPEDLLRKRDFMAASLSHDDLLRARRLSVQCYKSEYKNCD